MAAITTVLGYFAISMEGQTNGLAASWPLHLQFLSCLLMFEIINYAIHRAMHEAPGDAGRFLWHVHAAHHLPDRLYVLMHAVFHPINALLIQIGALILPVWIMGYDQRVVTLFVMINGLQGAISHFNMDVRMGWMNYIFVGPELHRYHHSANATEAKNYGATTPIFDMVFGTFVYKPGLPPEQLGVSEDSGLPKYSEYRKVIALPFS